MKRILITGATDGIGLETAKKMISLGHEVIIHGRNSQKLEMLKKELGVETYQADFSNLSEVKDMTLKIKSNYEHIDILINNAGVFKTSEPMTRTGHDARFVVNSVAPYLLTTKLLPLLKNESRVINLSSAAQADVNIDALMGDERLSDFEAYAQSKLCITQWTKYLADQEKENAPIYLSVNPGSLLGTKMVKEGFGTEGKNINIGVDILVELAFGDHQNRSGEYYDNDSTQFSNFLYNKIDVEKMIYVIKDVVGKTLVQH